MFRALLWKEWRALRALRWFGWALVPVLALGAWANAAGWLGRSTSSQDLVADVFPALLAFGVWPLLATMCGAQAFAGDRAAGTERFLLERPIRRGAIWGARFTASLATVLGVAMSHVALWFALVSLSGWTGNTSDKWGLFAIGLAVFGMLGLLGAAAAGAMTSSTLAAALGGMMFASIPIGLAFWGTKASPWARLGDVPFAALPPLLAVLALPLASFAAFCFGERSGRGRWWRGIPLLVGGVALSATVLSIGAPRVVAAQAMRSIHFGDYFPSPDGDAGWVVAQRPQRGPVGAGRSWLVEGDVVRTFDFAPERVAWSPDGRRVAALMIGEEWFEEVRIYARDGAELERIKNLTSDRAWGGLEWWADRPVVRFYDTVRKTHGLEHPSGNPGRRELFELPNRIAWYLARPTDAERADGTRRIVSQRLRHESGERPPAEIALHTVAGTGGLTPVAEGLAGKIPPTRYGHEVELFSPTGRFRLQVSRDDEKRIVDTETGAESAPFPPCAAGRWLADGRFIAAGRNAKLYAWDETRGVHEWVDFSDLGNVAHLEVSPDRRKVLVLGKRVEFTERESAPPDVKTLARWQRLYDVETGEWREFEIADRPSPVSRVRWASNDALYVSAAGYAGLRPIDGGPPRHLIGRP